MKTKFLLSVAIMSMTLTFAQSKQVDKILDNSEKSVSTVYNDGKLLTKTVYNDAKALSPKIEKAINSLAESFKTTTNNVWNILVKQQLVWSISFLILTIASLFNWYIFYKRNLKTKLKKDEYIIGQQDAYESIDNPDFDIVYYNKYKEYHGRDYWKENWTNIKYLKQIKEYVGKKDIVIPIVILNNLWFKYLHLIICIGLSGLSIYNFSDMLTGFINPEFGALKTIAKLAIQLK